MKALTLEEARALMPAEMVWMQVNDDDDDEEIMFEFTVDTNKNDALTFVGGSSHLWPFASYGSKWRLWIAHPSKEERIADKWKEDKT